MSDKIVLNRKKVEALKKDYLDTVSVVKITASYIRDLLYYATIEPKTDNPKTQVKNMINVEKAIHYFEDLAALFSDEELDKEQFDWENRNNIQNETSKAFTKNQNKNSHLRIISF